MRSYNPTREDLEALRGEFGAGDKREHLGFQRADLNLPYNLNDDLKQVRVAENSGLDLEAWSKARDVPTDYARALRRFIEQE